MLPRETIESGASFVCCEGLPLEVPVLKSGAGYYLGTWGNKCGPYSRESIYFSTEVGAETAFMQYNRGEKHMLRR